ncbi:S-adenosyl-L-methionine-dependent methyltransferase [Paraphysoderma sedebokerense]|nr:S-adenosyl-L-methionine-dependent methyltransferase [Paraphysoderma sedebokerense]
MSRKSITLKTLPYVAKALGARPRLKYPCLVDYSVAQEALSTLDKSEIESKTVIEANPGFGVLSREILKYSPKRLFLLEKAPKIVQYARTLAKENENVDLQEFDFMDMGLYYRLENPEFLGKEPITPWDQTPPISFFTTLSPRLGDLNLVHLIRFLADRAGIHYHGRVSLNLFVPRMISQRITAPEGNQHRGRLTVLVNTYADVKVLREGVSDKEVYPFWQSQFYDFIRMEPLIEPQIKNIPVDEYEYVLRHLFVKKTTPLEEAIRLLGSGAESLLNNIPQELHSRKCINFTISEWEAVVRAYHQWPFKEQNSDL